MKPFFVIAFVLIFAPSVSAQENRCPLKLTDLSQAEELLGFYSGMSTEQVKKRIPQVVFPRADEFGVVKTTINPHFDSRIDKTNLEDVRTISLDFIDGQLTSLWIGYESTFKWSNIDDFVKGISRSLKLPPAWSNWRDRGQQLRCVDFTITVTMLAGGVSFRTVDETAADLIATRREAHEKFVSSLNTGAEQIVSDRESKVYYPAGCAPALVIKEIDRIVFRSVEEAEKAGYKRAKHCD